MKSSSLIHKAAQVFLKDVKSELKTRYGIGSVALFAVTSLVVASFAVSPYALEADTQSAFLWIVLFFSAMSGLSRSFVKEEETKTALALKLSAPPLAVYFGKLLFNLVLMLGVEVIVVPMFLLFMDISLSSPLVFASSVLLGTLYLAASSTIVAAIIAKANSKGTLFAVLSFPICMPGLIMAVRMTASSLAGMGFTSVKAEMGGIAAFTVIITTLSSMLFEFVWNE
jgi:heme exporter protein B